MTGHGSIWKSRVGVGLWVCDGPSAWEPNLVGTLRETVGIGCLPLDKASGPFRYLRTTRYLRRHGNQLKRVKRQRTYKPH